MTSEPPLETVESNLAEFLFNQRSTMITGAVILEATVGVAWLRCSAGWLLAWGLAIALVVTLRCVIEAGYVRASRLGFNSGRWLRRYIVGAWLMGAVWGCGAMVFLTPIPQRIQFLIALVLAVTVMAAAARNAGSLVAARGQALLAGLPMVGASVFGSGPSSSFFGVCSVGLLIAAIHHSEQIHGTLRRAFKSSTDHHALSLALQAANRELELANERLEVAASTDALTGIANRRRFDEVMSREQRRAVRERSSLAVLLLDIDSFKLFNDRFGHQRGDACLLHVAQVFAATLNRPADFVARYGGEEFVAILPQTDTEAALMLADRVRANVAALAIGNPSTVRGIMTVSIGVTSGVPHAHQRPEDAIESADYALYEAKRSGRNCVRAASPRVLEVDAPLRGGALP